VPSALLTYGPCFLSWGAVVYRLPVLLRHRRDPGRRAYWLALLFLAVALTILLPPVYLWIDRLSGVANLSRLLGDSLGLIASWRTQSFFVHLERAGEPARRPSRLGNWALVGTLALMACLFMLAPVDREELDFVRVYGGAPFVLQYRLLLLAALGLALGSMVSSALRYAGATRQAVVALGLRLSAMGASFGLCFVAFEAARLVCLRSGLGDVTPDADLITQVLIAAALGFMLVGTTVPSWGTRVGLPALLKWLDQYRSYRRLYRLWRALSRVNPGITLLPAATGVREAFPIRDLDLRLYRRVVEIRDGQLSLRPYMDPAVAECARALCERATMSPEDTRAITEAAAVASALRNKVLGRKPSRRLTAPGAFGGADLNGEANWLERVASCYARSPIVDAAIAVVEGEPPADRRNKKRRLR
jgi:hypothetical protein